MAQAADAGDNNNLADDVSDAAKTRLSGGNERRSGRQRRVGGGGGGFLSLFGCGSRPPQRSTSPPSPAPASLGASASGQPAQHQKAAVDAHNGNSQMQGTDSRPLPEPKATAIINQPDAELYNPKFVYNMQNKHRGIALVFNFQEFNVDMQLNYRHGSDKDATNVANCLKKLDFKVHRHNNLTGKDFYRELVQLSQVDHKEHDAIAIVIMSHGEEGKIFARDCEIELTQVFEPFRQCESLVGKPKLFFLQACRGNKFDSGMEFTDSGSDDKPDFDWVVDCTDGIKTIQRLPTDADFLICYSVVPGYFSWRNGAHGSWFLQKLTEVLASTDCSKVEFLRVMTRVNRAVAYDFESQTSRPDMNQKKQVPSIVSMLTKELYFPPK